VGEREGFSKETEKNSNKYRKNKRGNPKAESSDVLSVIKDLFGYSLKY
jgi:hypothetical protein